ncbi:MAG: mandelate racemase/muconate lactonizing enzyme family protein [Hyphomonadaceae bacterium]|nr:mandelate racemase/muconate lactonizing enzyme family protein [Hyphomonadaceae bacterium]
MPSGIDLNRRDLWRAGLTGAAVGLAGPAEAGMAVAEPDPRGLLRFPPALPGVVDFTAWLSAPVIIRSIEVFQLGRPDTQFVRVISEDGVEGVVKANARMEEVISLLDLAVAPAFIGQDARDIARLIDEVYRRQYKFAGLALWTAIGHCELAIWDMLGKTAGRPCIDFMGPRIRDRVPIYVSSLARDTSPEVEVARFEEAVARTGARALKLKVGGRMSRNADASPGRQEALVALTRRTFGDAMTIYADANGSFDAPRAIEICAMLEDHGVDILEEPCPFEDFEMTAQVTAHVRRRRYKLKIAGGEQDGALERWRWYLRHRGLHILQPDFMYNGGMIRTLLVARMAAEAGVPVAPHYPRNGVEMVELLHFACATPNLYGFQEYRQRERRLDFEHEPRIAPANGELALPTGPGFGARYGASIWRDAVRLNRTVTRADL